MKLFGGEFSSVKRLQIAVAALFCLTVIGGEFAAGVGQRDPSPSLSNPELMGFGLKWTSVPTSNQKFQIAGDEPPPPPPSK